MDTSAPDTSAIARKSAVYRLKAEELRAAAENMSSQAGRESLLQIARSYDLLAQGMETRVTLAAARKLKLAD